MPAAIALCKFVGTISLGLLTGVSYTLSTQSLPSLLTLPSATPAAHTLIQTQRLAGRHILALSSISAYTLAFAFWLSPRRLRHPYLLWTSLLAWSSGMPLTYLMSKTFKHQITTEEAMDANGEQIEIATRDRQWMEFVRMGISGLGFVMGVVGIWGDGA
ncbi:Hypothetical protein R9X50_00561200 [Acrodontium crateriforme]|uniref:Uncharacterized protein n=1 Tax=Acrodontium crateriforme TaxID=150365 RepID=A0AAQ3R989_9PEZI|nr:Hypothetical protein R9X50_00561200 [Acrodontium crateriforme]